MSEETPNEAPLKRPATLTYSLPGSVTTLRQSYRGKLALPDTETFISELSGESDRAAVILASSLLDDLLANAIAMKMPFDILVGDMEDLFRLGGPLDSFSSRTSIACTFGIIEAETYKQLAILREMRNACAHSKHRIDFKTPILANVAQHFFKYGSIPEEIASKNMKMAFTLEVAFLAMVLSHGSREEARKLRAEAIAAHVASLGASRDTPSI